MPPARWAAVAGLLLATPITPLDPLHEVRTIELCRILQRRCASMVFDLKMRAQVDQRYEAGTVAGHGSDVAGRPAEVIARLDVVAASSEGKDVGCCAKNSGRVHMRAKSLHKLLRCHTVVLDRAWLEPVCRAATVVSAAICSGTVRDGAFNAPTLCLSDRIQRPAHGA